MMSSTGPAGPRSMAASTGSMGSNATPPRRPAKRAGRGGPEAAIRRDPVVAKALQLSTFEDGYSTEDFIAVLSDKLIAESKADPGPFDPTPLIDTLSPALDALLALRSQVAEQTKEMESDVRRANRQYGKRLRELDSGFEAVGSSFSNLESKITDVGQTAARIGEQLESLHHARSTAQATSLVMSYYLSLVHQTSTTNVDKSDSALETLFSTRNTREGRSRLSVVLRRLITVAKDMVDSAAIALAEAEALDAKERGGHNSPAYRAVLLRRSEKERAELVRDEVEKYCENFEKSVLKDFDRSYRKGDPSMMAHCATVLQDFNGGTSCVQIYVNQHDFFISTDKMLERAGRFDADVDQEDLWALIGDPGAQVPTAEPGLISLSKEIRDTVSQEAHIVKAVFPNPIAVMQVFLQRIFAQVIQQHIEKLVGRAASISTLAVLRILHLSHSMCMSLADDLKTYDATLGGYGVGSSSKIESVSGPLAAMLDQAVEEIFIPWLEGSRYLDTESKNLVELYGGLLSRFARYHETVMKAKPNSLLDRVVNSMSTSSTSPGANTNSPTSHGLGAAMSKYANLFASSVSTAGSNLTSPLPLRSSARLSMQTPSPRTVPSPSDSFRNANDTTPGAEDKANPLDGQVTVEMAEAMLRWHAEAVGRVVELSPSSDVAKNISALSKVLAEAIGRSFIETALDSALARLEQWDTKTSPDLTSIATLHPVDLVCNLWQRYSTTALLPLTSASVAVRREMTTFNQHSVVRMEGKINSVMQKTIDCTISWLSYLLTRQKRNDYKPRNDELSFARNNTEPCDLSCDFLLTVKESTSEGLSGKNAEAFLTEIGVAFHSLLLDHYKKFPINPTGGLMLTKDLALYQDTMSTYGIRMINDRFDMLRQLGNIFIVQPEVLRSYMTESHLGRIDSRLLKPYLQQRSDWSQISRSLALDDVGDDVSGSGTSTPSTLLPLRAGRRISAMSGVTGAQFRRLRDALRDFESHTDREKDREPVSPADSLPPPSAFNRSTSSIGTPPQQPKRGYPNLGFAYMGGS